MKKSVNSILKTNKKAQDLSIGTLILIVLGIIVLVLLILGFSMGWSNLWEKINIFGGKTSISDVVNACNLAVTSNARYTYCNEFREVTVEGKKEWLNCEDTRVASGLTNKLEGKCENVILPQKTEVSPAVKKCMDLIGDKTDSDKTKACAIKVNNELCSALTNCN